MKRLAVILLSIFLLSCQLQRTTNPLLGKWISINTGFGTHAPVLSLLAVGPETVYAAAYDRIGVYRSSLGSSEWVPDNPGLPPVPSFSLLSDGKVVWAATASGLYERASSSEAWHLVSGVPEVAVYALNRGAAGKLYAGTDGRGVYFSGDGGATWDRLPGMDNMTILSVLDLVDNTILAGTEGQGLYVSRDQGLSWVPVADFVDTYVPLLYQDPRNKDSVFAGTRRALMRSRDAGLSWEIVQGGIEKEQVYALAPSPGGQKLLAGTASHGIFVSVNDGETWLPQVGSLSQADNHVGPVPEGHAVLSFASMNGVIFAGTTDGVIKSVDQGLSWSPGDYQELKGIGAPRIHDLAVDSSNDTLFAATEDGLYTRTTGEWDLYGAGTLDLPVLSLTVAPSDPKVIFAGTSHRGVFISEDGGKSWSGAGGDLGGRASVAGLAFDSRNSQNVFARVLYERIYKSTDGGESWHSVWTGMPTYTEIESMAIDPKEPSRMYAGGDEQFFHSDDAGETWSGGALLGVSTLAITIDPDDSQRLVAGTTDGLYMSADGGTHWTRGGLAKVTVSGLARDNAGVLYVGTKNDGLFESRDNGRRVERLGSGLDHANVAALVMDDRRGIVYAATTEGVFCLRLTAAVFAGNEQSPCP